MSLNRIEQALFDYIRTHPEERQYFHHKVQNIVGGSDGYPAAAARIDSELRRYCDERRAVVPSFLGGELPPGPNRTSMRNLAEFLIRQWTEPKPRKPAQEGEGLRT